MATMNSTVTKVMRLLLPCLTLLLSGCFVFSRQNWESFKGDRHGKHYVAIETAVLSNDGTTLYLRAKLGEDEGSVDLHCSGMEILYKKISHVERKGFKCYEGRAKEKLPGFEIPVYANRGGGTCGGDEGMPINQPFLLVSLPTMSSYIENYPPQSGGVSIEVGDQLLCLKIPNPMKQRIPTALPYFDNAVILRFPFKRNYRPKYLLTMPVAFAGDIITSPIQIFLYYALRDFKLK